MVRSIVEAIRDGQFGIDEEDVPFEGDPISLLMDDDVVSVDGEADMTSRTSSPIDGSWVGGTGKTWNLAARYLDLVLAGVDPATISDDLQAAAAEIRDRVLNDAASLVLQPGADPCRDAGTIRRRSGQRGGRRPPAAGDGRRTSAAPDPHARQPVRVAASGLGPSSGVPVAVRLADEETAADVLREAIGRAIAEVDEDEVLSTLETLGRGHAR